MLRTAPQALSDLHAEYADAGATTHGQHLPHTAPHPRRDFAYWAKEAVRIARRPSTRPPHTGQSPGCRLLPARLEPPDASTTYAALAQVLVVRRRHRARGDLPHPDEGLIAARAALEAGAPTWLSLTAGPSADLMSPAQMQDAAEWAATWGSRGPRELRGRDAGSPFRRCYRACRTALRCVRERRPRQRRLGWGKGDPEPTPTSLKDGRSSAPRSSVVAVYRTCTHPCCA